MLITVRFNPLYIAIYNYFNALYRLYYHPIDHGLSTLRTTPPAQKDSRMLMIDDILDRVGDGLSSGVVGDVFG